MGIFSKCVLGAAENVKILNFSLMFIGYASFYCITVQIMQFPILDFGLDHYMVLSPSIHLQNLHPMISIYRPHDSSESMGALNEQLTSSRALPTEKEGLVANRLG